MIINSNPWQHPNTSAVPGTFPSRIISPISPVKHTQYGESFKPKSAGTNGSHVVFILDDSGSMQSCRKATIEGFNGFLQKQKQDELETGVRTFITLYKFDGKGVILAVDHQPAALVEPLTERTYNPQGSTNLHDAIGSVLGQINSKFATVAKKNRESVIVVVLTDGEENSSKVFTNADVKIMIEKSQGKNWGFVYLGANVDAFHVGSSLGFTSDNTLQYSTANMANTMAVAADKTLRMKAAYSRGLSNDQVYASTAFTQAERNSV